MNEKIFFLLFVAKGILSTPSNKPSNKTNTETSNSDPNFDYDDDQWLFVEEDFYKNSVVKIAQELYFGFAEEVENNFAFSPLSVHTIISILHDAASSNSKSKMELQKLLNPNQHTISLDLDDSIQNLTEFYASSGPLTIANSLWFEENLKINENFTKAVKNKFGLHLKSINFQTEDTSDKINEWISERTNGLISQLIQEISPETKIFLANALHFKDKWLVPFQDENLEGELLNMEEFYPNENDAPVFVPMMFTNNNVIRVAESTIKNQTVQVVKIPYLDENYQMKIIFPENLSAYEMASKATKQEQNIFNEFENIEEVLTEDVSLIMPKFDVSYKAELSDWFKLKNVTQIFKDAELGNLFNNQNSAPIAVSDIVHQSVIKVNKEGTEGAAATGVELVLLSGFHGQFLDLTLNRPFIFIVEDVANSIPILVGRVKNPLM